MHEFSTGGQSFRCEALKLRPALMAQAIIVEAIAPSFAAGYGVFKSGTLDAATLRAAVAGLERLPELVDTFAAVCKFDRGGQWVDLPPFLDTVFARRNTLLLAWLSACIEWQFADFFDESGRALLVEAASRYTSLLGLTGGSGESQPATT